MNWWQGIILGIVQGLTEFLPISSSGHLVVAQAAVGLNAPGVQVEVILHVATLLAVVIVYRATLTSMVLGVFRRDPQAWSYVLMLFVATIPAAAAGLWLADLFTSAFDSLFAVGINFLVTGTILWSTRRVPEPVEGKPKLGDAVAIGFAQALAILPGISRSGTTVAAAMWLKTRPVKAAEFSFLMAIPAIAGAAVLIMTDLPGGVGLVWDTSMVLSFGCALVSGIVAIRLLIALLQRRAFHRFAPYCWLLGLGTIVWALTSA